MFSLEALFLYPLKHPRLSLLLLVIISLVSIAGLSRLEYDLSYDALARHQIKHSIPDNLETFDTQNISNIYIKDPLLWSTEKLNLLESLTNDLEQLPNIKHVSSIFNAKNIRFKDSMLDSGYLMDYVPENIEQINKLKEDSIHNPLINGNLVAKDGHALLISLLTTNGMEESGGHNINERIKPYQDEFQEIFLLGSLRLNQEIQAGILHDLKLLTPLSLFILFICFYLFFQTAFSGIIPILTSVIAIAWTFGLMGFLGIPISLLSGIVPALIVVIGATEDTHIIASYLHNGGQKPPQEQKTLLQTVIKATSLPIFITATTTIIGFFTNIISDINLIKNFALASALGLSANLLVTILLVPLLLRRVNHKAISRRPENKLQKMVKTTVQRFESLRLRYPKQLLLSTATICVFFIIQLPGLQINNNPLNYFHDDHPLVKNSEHLIKEFGGLQNFHLIFTGNKSDFFHNLKALKEIDAIESYINDSQRYTNALSIIKHIKYANQELHQSKTAFYRLPDTQSELEEILLLLGTSELKPYLSDDQKSTRIIVRHNLNDSSRLTTTINELEIFIKTQLSDNIQYQISGDSLLMNKAAESLFAGQLVSLGLLVLIIFIIISLLFTSPLAGLVSLVPNLIPAILTFGVMALFDIPLNPGTAMVAAIAIGIAIDDTVHLMTRYARVARSSRHQAIEKTLASETLPIIATSITLAITFLTMGLSSFNIVSQFGLLAAAAMIYALLADLLITPIILKHIRLVGMWDILSFDMDTSVLMNSPLFENMSNYQIKKTILLSEFLRFPANSTIIQQDTTGSDMYVVLEGEMQVLINGQVLQKPLTAGDVFGEIGFASMAKRVATVKTTNQSSVLRLSQKDTRKSLRWYPGVAWRLYENISKILCQRINTDKQT